MEEAEVDESEEEEEEEVEQQQQHERIDRGRERERERKNTTQAIPIKGAMDRTARSVWKKTSLESISMQRGPIHFEMFDLASVSLDR